MGQRVTDLLEGREAFRLETCELILLIQFLLICSFVIFLFISIMSSQLAQRVWQIDPCVCLLVGFSLSVFYFLSDPEC